MGVGSGADRSERGGIAQEWWDAGESRFRGGIGPWWTNGFDHAEVASNELGLKGSGCGEGWADFVAHSGFWGVELLGELPQGTGCERARSHREEA